jgi:hypothetical protein
MGTRGKKMSSFLLTNYTIKIYNRCISVLNKYLLIISISLKLKLYNRSIGITLVNTIILFGITLFLFNYTIVLFGIWFDIDPVLLTAIIPIKSYSNAEAEKATILKENKNKSGIYMWKNLVNDKQYIGSSDNLKIRFKNILIKTIY